MHIQGPAKLMPWNSSKSNINPAHPVFQQLRPTLIQLVSYLSSLSRRMRNEWDEEEAEKTTGSIEQIAVAEITPGRRLNLPALPRVNKQQVDHLKTRNKKILKDQPWTVGLVEAIAAVDVITRQHFDTKNRMALILLDSNFEIALKEFIVHEPKLFPPHVYDDAKIQQLFKNRTNVINEVTAKVTVSAALLKKVRHYYGLRNKLTHERATMEVTDTDVENYRGTVESVLKTLFKLKFSS